VVVFTFVSPSLIETIYSQSIYYAVPTIDVLGPVFKRVEDLPQALAHRRARLLRHVDDEYFKRVSAMDFAVKHDDGLGGATLHQADIVLLGLSRCSKTRSASTSPTAASRRPTSLWSSASRSPPRCARLPRGS